MKQIYKIKSGSRAAVHGFEFGDWSGADAIEEHNQTILKDIYKRVQFGLSEYAYMNTGNAAGGLLYIVSRDPQYNGAVRVSVFVRYGSGAAASFVASSHHTYSLLCDFIRGSGLPSGRLFVVGGWYDNLLRGCA